MECIQFEHCESYGVITTQLLMRSETIFILPDKRNNKWKQVFQFAISLFIETYIITKMAWLCIYFSFYWEYDFSILDAKCNEIGQSFSTLKV